MCRTPYHAPLYATIVRSFVNHRDPISDIEVNACRVGGCDSGGRYRWRSGARRALLDRLL